MSRVTRKVYFVAKSHLFNLDNPKEFPPLPQEIIKDYLYTSVITTIWGPPDSGKSHIAIDMACTIAQKYPVVYVAAEASFEVALKATAWKNYREKTLSNNMFAWDEPLTLMNEDKVNTFMAEIKAKHPKMIFIDPLAQCFEGGDENLTKDMVIVTNNLAKITKDLGVGICLVAHTGKRESSGERGSSVLRAFCRLSFSVSKPEDLLTMKCVKKNVGKKPIDRLFTITQVGDDSSSSILLPADKKILTKLPDNIKINFKQQLTLTELDMEVFANGVNRTEFLNYMLTTHNIPNPTAYRYVNVLIKKNLVELHGANIIKVTEDGHDLSQIIKAQTDSQVGDNSDLNWIITNSQQFSHIINNLQTDNSTDNSNSQIITPDPPFKGEGDNEGDKLSDKKLVN